MPNIRTLYIYVSKNVRVHDYFPKPKGVREQKSLGNTGLAVYQAEIRKVHQLYKYGA